MMDIINPWLIALAMILLYWLAAWPFRLVNRWIRHRNIVAKGWPPPHLDADGDFQSREHRE